MANKNGITYGLTVLCPIRNNMVQGHCGVDLLRDHLRALPQGRKSLFGSVPETHLARLSIMDDVFFEGTVAREDNLKSRYLWFNSNFDGDLCDYLDSMFDHIPQEIEAIWRHCTGFPGIESGREKWKQYIYKCQIKTTFFFAAINDMTVENMLRGLMLKQEFSAFVAEHQGKDAAEIQKEFLAFMETYKAAPTPARGSVTYQFENGEV
ncbi:hypothetical protein [Paremcibacter congregatus]|uniref:Uncharacterized protein n=1 Tax=Paremcibacter congregatus TaxID=2043170 RepID=A0A2G4YNH2_9PROT|nr:hypothetical protein [Paremcibacter congregatus]PHZ83843.1 hypothetical protein CRD36_15945 [Paremcibacter congregatus]QDE27548.1 hypothetical protein FIV45_09780 [Paremcibacter congregatus]